MSLKLLLRRKCNAVDFNVKTLCFSFNKIGMDPKMRLTLTLEQSIKSVVFSAEKSLVR